MDTRGIPGQCAQIAPERWEFLITLRAVNGPQCATPDGEAAGGSACQKGANSLNLGPDVCYATMPSNHTLNASLTDHLRQFVAKQVASGCFGNSSEVVGAGARLLERDILQTATLPGSLDGAHDRPGDPASQPGKPI
jgi:putative addiction module CopG family antidote